MMMRKVTTTVLTLAMVMIAGCPTFTAASANTAPEAPASTPAGKSVRSISSFVAPDFNVPTLVENGTFKIVPLGPDLVKKDFDAYMSSIKHLQKTFSRSTAWPREDISDADAMRDMENEQGRFRKRQSFAYSVLTPDGLRERGCVYVAPSPVPGYDAVVQMWVTQADYDAGFDAQLYAWVANWMQKDWPFAKIAYPGRAIEWSRWDTMVAASKAAKTAP